MALFLRNWAVRKTLGIQQKEQPEPPALNIHDCAHHFRLIQIRIFHWADLLITRMFHWTTRNCGITEAPNVIRILQTAQFFFWVTAPTWALQLLLLHAPWSTRSRYFPSPSWPRVQQGQNCNVTAHRCTQNEAPLATVFLAGGSGSQAYPYTYTLLMEKRFGAKVSQIHLFAHATHCRVISWVMLEIGWTMLNDLPKIHHQPLGLWAVSMMRFELVAERVVPLVATKPSPTITSQSSATFIVDQINYWPSVSTL